MVLSDSNPMPSRLSSAGEVRRALHPLQVEADRLGRQVEEFAETLDRLYSNREATDEHGNHRIQPSQAFLLVQGYEKIASDTVKRLKRRHGDEHKQILRENRRRKLGHGQAAGAVAILDEHDGAQQQSTGTNIQDLLHWEQERQTWELLGLMLQVRHPVSRGEKTSGISFLERPQPSHVHHYSTEFSIYQNYLASDDAAWEKHVISEWLSRVADEPGEDIYDVVSCLDETPDRSSGVMASGWLFSKEAIKQQKRLQSWPQPLDPETIGMPTSLMEMDRSQVLVTQLDPDAFSRQGRGLQQEDVAFERATWLGCWELIKRGKDWEEVWDWFHNRLESWRAMSLRNDPRLGRSKHQVSGDLSGRAQWQRMCMQLARNGGVDDYERAVYGLLGGDDQTVLKICKTWDDHLYGFVSCQLIQRFSYYYCEKFRMPPVISSGDDQGSWSKSLERFIDSLRTKPETKEEANTFFKSLQGAIISGNMKSLIQSLGSQLSDQLQNRRYGSFNRNRMDESVAVNGHISALTLDDHDTLRILTHIILAMTAIDPEFVRESATENIIVAYVDFLGKAGKQQLLPLYVSKLSEDRAAVCMARQLPFIKERTERQVVMNLMKQYGMEYEVILLTQLEVIISDAVTNSKDREDFPKLRLLEKTNTDSSEIPQIKTDIMGDELTEWQDDLIDALEWFLLLEGRWNEVFSAGLIVYKHFFRTKSWSAARKLTKSISYSRLAEMKTQRTYGEDTDVIEPFSTLDDEDVDMDGLHSEERTECSTLRQTRKEQLISMSRTFQSFEDFVTALDALDQWEKVWHAGTDARLKAQTGDKTEIKEWKKLLQQAHSSVTEIVEGLLRGWMMSPKDDDEKVEIAQIRRRMLPELVLAYLAVLSFGGTWLGRENLLQCMNIGQIVADETGDLCDLFVSAGRVAELMTILASVSRQIVAADETTGGIKLKKRRGEGELLDIWSVKSI